MNSISWYRLDDVFSAAYRRTGKTGGINRPVVERDLDLTLDHNGERLPRSRG